MNETSERGVASLRVLLEDVRSPLKSPVPCEDLPDLVSLARTVLEGEGIGAAHVYLYLVDSSTMAELNLEHMGIGGPTDVLAFPMDGPLDTSPIEGLVVNLGDVVLCVDVAAAQASSHCGSLTAELQLLTIHGTLHLLGHDHAESDERSLMQAREAHYLSEVGVVHPGNQP